MKTLKIIIAAILFVATTSLEAQVTVGAHFGPPVWAPKAPATVQYYYLPDINTYYDASERRYIYMNNGAWVRTTTLPVRYKGYDLYTSRPVYLSDYKGNAPYKLYKVHKVKYKGNGWKRNGHGKGKRKVVIVK